MTKRAMYFLNGPAKGETLYSTAKELRYPFREEAAYGVILYEAVGMHYQQKDDEFARAGTTWTIMEGRVESVVIDELYQWLRENDMEVVAASCEDWDDY